jgi:hypothetical protein
MNWALVLMASQSIFPEGSTLEQRQAILKKYFSPKPGEMLEVTPRAIAVERRDPLLVKGELWIDPPKGTCIVVRRDYEQKDRTYCKKTPITWDIFDLDAAGRLHFNVFLDNNPETTFITWPSPYRVANYVPLGAMESGENFNIPIFKCEAVDDGSLRRIILHTMDNRRWYILLPEYDQALKAAEPLPNLRVQSDVKKEEPAPAANAEKKPAKSVLGQLLSGEYKKAQQQEFIFRVSRRNAYEMSSSGFSETSSPQGMQGKCRYTFSGAPGDPDSGVIECYDTDTFDTIYTHVTCFSEFKPKLKPVK